jgi:hypothetical protein
MVQSPNRGLVLSIVIAMTVVGALAGLLLDADSDEIVTASIVVRIKPRSPGIRVIQEVLRTPDVVNTALGDAGISADPREVARDVKVAPEPDDGLVSVTVPADDEEEAIDLANALVVQAAAVGRMAMRQTDGDVDYSFGDFEHGRGSWDSVSTTFNNAPDEERVTSPGLTNSHALHVECDDSYCGASIILRGLFLPDRVYTGLGYARADDNDFDLSMTLGANSEDFSTGRFKPLGPDWRRFEAQWRPSAIRDSAVLAMRTEGPGEFDIDSVVVATGDAPGSPSASRFRKAGRSLRVGLVRPPLAVERSDSDSRVQWAVLGALAGFAIAMGATLAGWLAFKRR